MATARGRKWWKDVRLPQVERAACREIQEFERRLGPIMTTWVPIEQFVEHLWECRLLYADPEELGYPSDMEGALLPAPLTVLVSDRVAEQAQQNMVMAHEGAHYVLHAPPALRALMRQEGSGAGLLERARPFLCGAEWCARGGLPEPPWQYWEAEHFAACLLLPRSTFAERAEQRIWQAWREEYRGHRFPGPDWHRGMNPKAVVPVLERAVPLLYGQYEGQVSRTVIRIRLSEVGLAPEPSSPRLPRHGLASVREALVRRDSDPFGPFVDAAGTGWVVRASFGDDERRTGGRRAGQEHPEEVPGWERLVLQELSRRGAWPAA